MELNATSKTKINIRKLKDFAFSQLQPGSALRETLLAENEEISVIEFLMKVPLWLKLSTLKGGSKK